MPSPTVVSPVVAEQMPSPTVVSPVVAEQMPSPTVVSPVVAEQMPSPIVFSSIVAEHAQDPSRPGASHGSVPRTVPITAGSVVQHSFNSRTRGNIGDVGDRNGRITFRLEIAGEEVVNPEDALSEWTDQGKLESHVTLRDSTFWPDRPAIWVGLLHDGFPRGRGYRLPGRRALVDCREPWTARSSLIPTTLAAFMDGSDPFNGEYWSPQRDGDISGRRVRHACR